MTDELELEAERVAGRLMANGYKVTGDLRVYFDGAANLLGLSEKYVSNDWRGLGLVSVTLRDNARPTFFIVDILKRRRFDSAA